MEEQEYVIEEKPRRVVELWNWMASMIMVAACVLFIFLSGVVLYLWVDHGSSFQGVYDAHERHMRAAKSNVDREQGITAKYWIKR